MRQVLAIAVVATLGLLVAAAPAGASASKGPSLRSLQAQITSLQKQVKTLKKRATRDETLIGAEFAYSACTTAVTADTFQDTWTGLDRVFAAHAWAGYFGAQSPLNDYQSCQIFRVVRSHNQSPPTTAVFGALLDLFKPGSSAAGHQSFMNLARQSGYPFGELFVLPR